MDHFDGQIQYDDESSGDDDEFVLLFRKRAQKPYLLAPRQFLGFILRTFIT